jgi:hypothetical protein
MPEENLMSASLYVRMLTSAAVMLLAACADDTPLAPDEHQSLQPQLTTSLSNNTDNFIATLRRVTARYHNLDAAIADGFVLLHPCEVRGEEGPVGAVYAHFGRVLDGVIDPELPDALIYEPSKNGKSKLVGVEFAQPYPFAPQAPTFMGATFQPEDEFGVWALHIWVWRHNPEGLFAESNPRVSCS